MLWRQKYVLTLFYLFRFKQIISEAGKKAQLMRRELVVLEVKIGDQVVVGGIGRVPFGHIGQYPVINHPALCKKMAVEAYSYCSSNFGRQKKIIP